MLQIFNLNIFINIPKDLTVCIIINHVNLHNLLKYYFFNINYNKAKKCQIIIVTGHEYEHQ